MNTRARYEDLYRLPEPRPCKYFDPKKRGAWTCSRGQKCKFEHCLRDRNNNVIRRWPTQTHAKKTVAYMTEEDMLGTEVQRSNAPGKCLKEFLQHQWVQPDILGDAHFSEGGSCFTFTLHAKPPDYLVELLQAKNDTKASQDFVVYDRCKKIEAKLSTDGVAEPCEGVYYTDVWNALGTLVTGHLVGVDGSRRHGCHFAAIPKQGEIFCNLSERGGVMFRARLHGMTLSNNAAPKIKGVVPMGVILKTHDGGFLTDMWSHELTEVTFSTDSLLTFFQEWTKEGRPKLSMPVPEITSKFAETYSHRLIATSCFKPCEYDMSPQMQMLDEQCKRLQARHVEYKEYHDYEMSQYKGIGSIVRRCSAGQGIP